MTAWYFALPNYKLQRFQAKITKTTFVIHYPAYAVPKDYQRTRPSLTINELLKLFFIPNAHSYKHTDSSSSDF